MCESFNGTELILEAREKPILKMLEMIRIYLTKRLASQRILLKKWKFQIGPRIHGILEANKMESGHCTAIWVVNKEFQIFSKGAQYVVDLGKKSCSVGDEISLESHVDMPSLQYIFKEKTQLIMCMFATRKKQ